MATKKKKLETTELEPVERSNVTYDRTGWKFYVNDSQVTEQEYIAIMDEHMRWAEEQDAKAAAALEPEPKKRKKK